MVRFSQATTRSSHFGWSLTGGFAVDDPKSLYGFFFARLTSWNTGNQSLYLANRRNAKQSSISSSRQTINNETRE